jgi:hypothetical protein
MGHRTVEELADDLALASGAIDFNMIQGMRNIDKRFSPEMGPTWGYPAPTVPYWVPETFRYGEICARCRRADR